ncbi:MAG: permease, partial [Muribaculaceae bacterium]|nr:permease [Muribaculaceae bacterium]
MEYLNAFLSMLNAMSPYLLLGFLIAGVLHAFVPSRLYSRYLSGTGFKSVATAAAIGVPLPLCSCGVLP